MATCKKCIHYFACGAGGGSFNQKESLLESLKCCIALECEKCPSQTNGTCNNEELVTIPLWMAKEALAQLEHMTSVSYKIRNAYDFVTTVKAEESKLRQE